MDVPWRRMRNDDVNSAFPPDPGTQTSYLAVHFPFGILVRPAIVPARTFQAENIFSPELNQFIGQGDTTSSAANSANGIGDSLNKLGDKLPGGLAGGAAAGGIMALLMGNKSDRKFAGKAAGYGGDACLRRH